MAPPYVSVLICIICFALFCNANSSSSDTANVNKIEDTKNMIKEMMKNNPDFKKPIDDQYAILKKKLLIYAASLKDKSPPEEAIRSLRTQIKDFIYEIKLLQKQREAATSIIQEMKASDDMDVSELQDAIQAENVLMEKLDDVLGKAERAKKKLLSIDNATGKKDWLQTKIFSAMEKLENLRIELKADVTNGEGFRSLTDEQKEQILNGDPDADIENFAELKRKMDKESVDLGITKPEDMSTNEKRAKDHEKSESERQKGNLNLRMDEFLNQKSIDEIFSEKEL